MIQKHINTWRNDGPKVVPTKKSAAASNATWHATSTGRLVPQPNLRPNLDRHRRVYFALWMMVPSPALKGARPVDLRRSAEASALLTGLERTFTVEAA